MVTTSKILNDPGPVDAGHQAIEPETRALQEFRRLKEECVLNRISGGLISSMWRSKTADAAIDTTRQLVATIVVRRREVIRHVSGVQIALSFQVPAFEDQNCAAESHCRVRKSVKRILQDELCADGLLMSHRADHIKRRKVRNQIRHARCEPSCDATCQLGKAAQVVRKTPDNEQRKREDSRHQRRRKRREQ